MKITGYKSEIVQFVCDKCGNYAEREVTQLIKDKECALEIELICPYCKEDRGFVYYLKCKDPARAADLQARLDFIKIKRAAEVKDGNQESVA